MLRNANVMLTAAAVHTVMTQPIEGLLTEILRTSDFHTADLHAVHKLVILVILLTSVYCMIVNALVKVKVTLTTGRKGPRAFRVG
jgi:hypothetical protein